MTNRMYLDVEDSILQSKLRLPEKDKEEEDFRKIIDSWTKNDESNSILVYPSPGICIKVKNQNGEKTFINICTSDEIPPPEEISQEKLLTTVMQDDVSYVIPISIGQEKLEVDKSGSTVPTYDVLINKQYFEKCLKIKSFMMFTITVIIDGVSDKFNKVLNPREHVILKNRKVIGQLQPHRIEKRPVKKPSELAPPAPLIQEISSKCTPTTLLTQNEIGKKMEHVLLKNTKNQDNSLIGLFKVQSMSAKNVSLEISEDRLRVEDNTSNRFIDLFLPNTINSEGVKAYMDCNIGILRVHLPLQQ